MKKQNNNKDYLKRTVNSKGETIVSITLEDIRKLSALTEEEEEKIVNFKEDYADPECPPLTREQLSRFKKAKDVFPDWFKSN